MTIRTIAYSDRARGHEQAFARRLQQPQQLLHAALTLLDRFGCGHPPAAVLEGVLPALASAHATTNTSQLAKPIPVGDTAARRRTLERALEVARCCC
jgi:hypothetical protein